MQIIAKAAVLVWRTDRRLAAFLCLLTVAQGLLPGARLLIGKAVIDGVVDARVGHGSWDALAVNIAVLGAASVGSVVSGYAAQAVTMLLGRRVAHALSVSVLGQAIALDLSYFEQGDFYDQLQRAERDGSHRPLAVVTLIAQLAQTVVTVGAMAVVLARVGWWTVPLLCATTTPQILVQVRYARMGYSLQRRRTADVREAQYLAYILTCLEHVKEMKLFKAGAHILERYSQLFGGMHAEEQSFTVRSMGAASGTAVFSVLGYVAFYGYVAYRACTGHITIGELTVCVGAYQQCQADLGAACRTAGGLYEHALYLGNVWEYLGLRPRLSDSRVRLSTSRPITHGITFRGVSFRYPGTDRWAIKDVDLQIARNQCVALVGANGAGKTTVLKLLCRFYDPDEGEILLDGRDIRRFALEEYRELVGAVFQDFSRYHFQARTNIAIGRLDCLEDMARIRDAARRSGASRAIERLPGEYDAILGRYFSNGHQLSIGEWQKVAIARAIMRDSPVLLLDEPMAALDPNSEEELLATLRSLRVGKIMVLVSHRLSSARIADRIVVLEGGCVHEHGTHDDLVAIGGKYASMFAVQSRRYSASWTPAASPVEYAMAAPPRTAG